MRKSGKPSARSRTGAKTQANTEVETTPAETIQAETQAETGVKMANTATIRDAYGVPAIFVGSKTGRDDAPFVFVRVGDEERRMRWSEWDSLPAWTGARPSWAGKQKQ
jgi:hypothetical protein